MSIKLNDIVLSKIALDLQQTLHLLPFNMNEVKKKIE